MDDANSTHRELLDEVRALRLLVAEFDRAHRDEPAPTASAPLLQAILEAAPDFISASTLDRRVLFINPAGRAMIGLGPDEDVRRRAIEEFHPKWAFEVVRDRAVPAVLREGSWSGETALLHADGHEIPVSHVITAHRDERGALRFFSTIIRDITPLKHAEQALRESEERFRAIIEASPMGCHMYELRPDDRLVFVGANPAADRILGFENARYFGQTIEEAFPPLLGTEVPRRYREVATTGTHWQTEQIVYVDEQRSVRGVYQVYAFRTGPDRMATMFLDITERKRFEEALARSEQRYRLLAENATDVIWTLTPDWRFDFVSAAIETLAGFEPEELIGQPLVDQLTESSAATVRGTFEEQLSRPRDERLASVTLELQQRRRDGEIIDVEINAVWLHDGQGEVAGIQGITRDISERKRAERERDELHERLQQAQKMEAVGRLAGGVAHDFNNILTAIIGYSELLAATLPLDDPRQEDFAEVLSAADRARSLTEQLLAFSRKQIIAPRVLDLNEIVAGCTRMLQRIIGEDVELVFDRREDLAAIRADPSQIEQILVNLAVNARDAMPAGGRLVIATENLEEAPAGQPDAAGRYVSLVVSDDGCGMDRETARHIFEPFFSTKGAANGTGLGLSTVYGIVKQNGGWIDVATRRESGTAFTICFPAVDQAPAAEPAPRPPATRRGTETVLLVEDEQVVRRLGRKLLERHGYTVMEADSGDVALRLAAARQEPVDLLLTDVVMPGINGRELYRRLRQRWPTLRVLYMSGYNDEVIGQHGVLQEGIHFVAKPFSSETLSAKVREALDSESQ